MKKLIVSLVLIGASTACTTKVITVPGPVAASEGSGVGAPDAVSAVRGFLAAAKEPDLQAMGKLFGDTQGPARQGREDLEKREVIMARCLRHDSYDIVADAPNPGGGRNFVINLNFHEVSRSANFQVVMGPERRWYVQSFDPSPLQDICSRRA